MFRILVCLFGLVAFSSTSNAQFVAPGHSWGLVCPDDTVRPISCVATVGVVGEEDAHYWVKVGGYYVEGGVLRLTFVVSPEAKVRRTILLRGDRHTKGFLSHSCTAESCRAVWNLNKSEVEDLLQNTILTVEFSISEYGGIRFVLPMAGLKEALLTLQAK
jgi:hypothetical protein